MTIAEASPAADSSGLVNAEQERRRFAQSARAALAAEWKAKEPQSPSEVLRFYKESAHLEADLDAFHTDPSRKLWTVNLVHVAKQMEAKITVDIGSGAGHDLTALREAIPDLEIYGVEPNDELREMSRGYARMAADVETAPIETADLISCFDVLEHVVDPESFISSIARRARVGAVLMETCATFDTGTPLHLRENRGWKPGRALEAAGWVKRGGLDRMRVWQRLSAEPILHTALLICAFRAISLPTVQCILQLLDDPINPSGWRVSLNGEAGINRSRSIMASRWWAETSDDVFLMLDDDIMFTPEDAEQIVALCRNGHDIICAAYPVRDGGHVAIRGVGRRFEFGPGLPPVEIRYAATGFIAVHRRVLDALIPTLPLCHGNQPWAFWPLFDFKAVEDEASGGHNYLSEDWNFCDMALKLGFKVWLDPSIQLQHLGQVPISVSNMEAVHALFGQKGV